LDHCFPRGFKLHFFFRFGSANIAMFGCVSRQQKLLNCQWIFPIVDASLKITESRN
jgi:hypothetical protein